MARPSPLSSTRQTCLGSHSGLCVWGEVSVSIYPDIIIIKTVLIILTLIIILILIIKTLLIMMMIIITWSPGCC